MKQSWGQGPIHRFWQTSWEAMEMEKELSIVAFTIQMEYGSYFHQPYKTDSMAPRAHRHNPSLHGYPS